MRLVLEDLMVRMKELEEQMASMQSERSDLEGRFSFHYGSDAGAEMAAPYYMINWSYLPC